MSPRLALCVAVALFVPSGQTQTHTATVRGIVTDTSGARVGDAAVTLTNTDRKTTRKVATNEIGEYVFVQIPPGPYSLLIEAPGFVAHRHNELALQVAGVAVIDVELQVGTVTAEIEVTEGNALIESGSAAIAEVITGRVIRSHPLGARNATNLIALAPGITTSRAFRVPGFSSGVADRVSFSATGGRRLTNEILLDGSSQVVMGTNQPAYIPTPDAVQEFSVQSNSAAAEYGRTGGAIINIVHRSGTQDFHGTLYGVLRNDKLNANGFFANRHGRPRGSSRLNQYGFIIGGPLTRSRMSTFFFFNYEGARGSVPLTQTFTVPTTRMRNGDFSELPVLVYDPKTIDAAGRRLPFPGNRIQPDRWDLVGVSLVRLYPEPTLPGIANNLFTEAPQRISESNYSVKIDRRVSDAHNLFARFSWNVTGVEAQNWFRNMASPGFRVNQGRNASATLDNNLTVGRWILHGNYGYARSAPLVRSPTEEFDATTLGFPESFRGAAQIPLFPSITVSGQAGLGPGALQVNGNRFETHSAIGDATRSLRGHMLKFGGVWRMNRGSLFRPNAPAGAFSFDEGFTREAFNNIRGGHSIASLLLGLPSAGRIGFEPALAVQVIYAAIYFQDTWRVTSRLAMNVGLRWDTDRPLTERYDRTSWFDLDAVYVHPGLGQHPLRGGLVFAGRNGMPRGNKDADNNNFAPRIGLAWLITSKVVTRSGFAVIYHPTTGNEPSAANTGALSFNSETPFLASLDSMRTPFATLSNPFPSGFARPENGSGGLATLLGQSMTANLRSDRVPYSMQWNSGFQFEMHQNLLLETVYAGSAGVRLPASAQLNQLPDEFLRLGDELRRPVANPYFGIAPPTSPLGAQRVAAGQLLRPYPQLNGLVHVNGSLAHSTYHSLQGRLRKRYGNGLDLLIAYTWSKLLDDTSVIMSGGQASSYTNSNRRRLDKSLSALDIAHRMVASFHYELPFGEGRRVLAVRGIAGALVTGWNLSGIITLESGPPISVTSQDSTFSFGGVQRPNSTGVTSRTTGEIRERLDGYLNPAAFVNPPAYSFGNVGRFLPDNRGPALQSWDLALTRNVNLGEGVRLEIRADAFNALNNVNFLPPVESSTIFGHPQFGKVTEAEAARTIQLGLKLHF